MDIRTLLRDDDPDGQLFSPSYQQEATAKNARSSLPAHTGLYDANLSHSQPATLRGRLRSSQKDLIGYVLNSSEPFTPCTMDGVMEDEPQSVDATEDPEVMEAAQILVMMSNDCNGEGANNNKRREESISQAQEGRSSQSTVMGSPNPPVHHYFGYAGAGGLDHNSLYQKPSIQVPVHGNSMNFQPQYSSDQSNQYQKRLKCLPSQEYYPEFHARQLSQDRRYSRPELANDEEKSGYKTTRHNNSASALNGRQDKQEAQEYVLNPSVPIAPLRRSNRVRLQKELIQSGEEDAPSSIPADPKTQTPQVTDRSKMKRRFEFETGYQQLEQEICAATGFEKPPAEDASIEESDRYFFAALAYLNKKMVAKNNKWKELERGEEFIRQMGRQTFSFVEDEDEDEGIPEFKQFTDPPPVRTSKNKGVRKAPTAEVEHQERPRKVAECLKKRPSEEEPQAETQAETQTQAQTQTQEVCASASFDGDQNTRRQDDQTSKKRRLAKELSTTLGEGWDARFDNEGHRVSRNSKKMPH